MYINAGFTVNATVPPYLLFCVGTTIPNFNCSSASGAYVDFGFLTPDHTADAETQLLAATNAQNGYNIRPLGTTMTSGNNIIPALATDTPSQTGVSQFGLNVVADQQPSVGADPAGPGVGTAAPGYNVPNQYRFNSGEAIAQSAHADDFRRYTTSYIVNVSKVQAAGVYASTLTFVCLANF
jgi:hypothetical protein